MPSLLSKYRKKRDSHKSEDNSSAHSGEKSPRRVASNASAGSEPLDSHRPAAAQSPYAAEKVKEETSPQRSTGYGSSIQESPVGHVAPTPSSTATPAQHSPGARGSLTPGGSQAPPHSYRKNSQDNPWAEWEIRRACPSPRFGHSANYIAARDGELFIMGGIRDMDILDDLWVIDTNMLTGYQLVTDGAKVGPRVGHASLVLGNAHVVFGGDTKIQETDPLDDNLYLLNTSSLKWTVAQTVRPRPCGRYGHSLSNLGARIYVFGGQVDDMFFDDMWAFDLTTWRSPTAKWVKIAPTTPPPPPRTNHTVVTWHDKLYLFGGANGDLWYSDTWVFDPSDRSWTQLECTGYVPAPCQGHATTIVGDVMYVFGGMSSQGQLIDQLFALRLPSLKWYTFQNLGPGPSPRSGHSLTAFDGDKILVWGGTDQTNAAFVLDVSRINYPPEAPVKQEPKHVKSVGEPPAIPAPDVPQQTSTRTTPAARNSMMLSKRGSVILPASPMREQVKSYVSDSDEEHENAYVSAMDLPSKNEGYSGVRSAPGSDINSDNGPGSEVGVGAGAAGAGAAGAGAAAAAAATSLSHKSPGEKIPAQASEADKRPTVQMNKDEKKPADIQYPLPKSLPEYEGDTSLEDELRNMPGGLPSPSTSSPKADSAFETNESKIPRSVPQTNLASIPQETLRAAADGHGASHVNTSLGGENVEQGISGNPVHGLDSSHIPKSTSSPENNTASLGKSSSFKEAAQPDSATKLQEMPNSPEYISPGRDFRGPPSAQSGTKPESNSSLSSGVSDMSASPVNKTSPRRQNPIHFKGAEDFSPREFGPPSPEKHSQQVSRDAPRAGFDKSPGDSVRKPVGSPDAESGSRGNHPGYSEQANLHSLQTSPNAAKAAAAAAAGGGISAAAVAAHNLKGEQDKKPVAGIEETGASNPLVKARAAEFENRLNNATVDKHYGKGDHATVSPKEKPYEVPIGPSTHMKPQNELKGLEKSEKGFQGGSSEISPPLKVEKLSKGAPSLVQTNDLATNNTPKATPSGNRSELQPEGVLQKDISSTKQPETPRSHLGHETSGSKSLRSPVHDPAHGFAGLKSPGLNPETAANGLRSPAFPNSKSTTPSTKLKSPDTLATDADDLDKQSSTQHPLQHDKKDSSISSKSKMVGNNPVAAKESSTPVKGNVAANRSLNAEKSPEPSAAQTNGMMSSGDGDKLHQFHTASQRELLESKDTNKKLQYEKDVLQSKYSNANSKLEQLTAAMEGHVAALRAQAQRLQTAEQKIEELTEQNSELRQSLGKNTRSTENAGLVAEVAALTAQWKHFNDQAAEPSNGSRSLQPDETAHFKDLYETHRGAADSAHKDLEKAYADIAALRTQISNHETQTRDLEATHKSHLAQHNELEQQLLKLRRSHEELEGEYDRAMEYSHNQQVALTRTREDLNHLRASYQRLEEQMQEMKLSTDPDASQGSIGSVNARHAQLLIRDLRAQIVITEEERDELREQVRTLKKAALVNKT